MTGSARTPRVEAKRLIALAWTEELAVPKQLRAVMYRFGLVTSGRRDKVAVIGLAARRLMGI